MKVISLADRVILPHLPKGCAVALGNFDGFHYGHRRIVSTAVAKAAEAGTKCAVWTFSELAKAGGTRTPFIATGEEKLDLLASSGADFAVFEDFSAVRDMSADDFIERILLGSLSCSFVVCGFNFRFGRGAAGTPEILKSKLAEHGVETLVLDPVSVNLGGKKVVVSSTAIRSFVADGDMESAAVMLGRPFFIGGIVVNGKHLGRTIGVPTVNQNFTDGQLIPKCGVYASSVSIDSVMYRAVTNVGRRPTVDGSSVNAETHIFSYDGDLYGRRLRVYLYKFLRGEEKYSSVDELSAAIRADSENADRYFNETGIL